MIDAPWLARDPDPFRVVLGPQDDYFAAGELCAFFRGHIHADTRSPTAWPIVSMGRTSRMREGTTLCRMASRSGAIQIAGDKKPLVLMADRQPTGGYPKLGHVARADIGRLAQMRPGETCRFREVSVAEARAALLRARTRLRRRFIACVRCAGRSPRKRCSRPI